MHELHLGGSRLILVQGTFIMVGSIHGQVQAQLKNNQGTGRSGRSTTTRMCCSYRSTDMKTETGTREGLMAQWRPVELAMASESEWDKSSSLCDVLMIRKERKHPMANERSRRRRLSLCLHEDRDSYCI